MKRIFAKFPFTRIPFTKNSALTLFLVTSFPINFWAILVWFKNIESITQTEGLWGAIGVGAYLLTFALFESIVIFMVLLAFSMLFPKQWGEKRALAQISTVYLALSTGLILQQARAFIEIPKNGDFWRMINVMNNLASSYIEVLLVVGVLGGGAMLVWIHRSDKVLGFVTQIIGRLVFLSGMYIVVNLLGIIIIIIRNI